MTVLSDEHVDRLAEVAAQLAARVRDETPADNATWLAEQLPDPADWFRLAFTLAAAVPLDKPFRHLVGWVTTVDREREELIAHRRAVLNAGMAPRRTAA